jgi:EAL domain-containing protein (putative c-di-GMP-specific phosphodiesterase class I)
MTVSDLDPRLVAEEPGFAGEVAAALHEAGLAPQRLVVEATETAVLKGGQVLATLRALHDLGVRLALDDFGTGQSSLGLLQTCPVDILKLDKSFVDGVTGAEQQAAVAAAIARMAQALGLDAVAEGIETSAQAERLWELGYRLGQGFIFARPLAAEELGRLLPATPAPTPPDCGSIRPCSCWSPLACLLICCGDAGPRRPSPA